MFLSIPMFLNISMFIMTVSQEMYSCGRCCPREWFFRLLRWMLTPPFQCHQAETMRLPSNTSHTVSDANITPLMFYVFNVQCSMFNVQCSMFNVQCSMSVQCLFNCQVFGWTRILIRNHLEVWSSCTRLVVHNPGILCPGCCWYWLGINLQPGGMNYKRLDWRILWFWAFLGLQISGEFFGVREDGNGSTKLGSKWIHSSCSSSSVVCLGIWSRKSRRQTIKEIIIWQKDQLEINISTCSDGIWFRPKMVRTSFEHTSGCSFLYTLRHG